MIAIKLRLNLGHREIGEHLAQMAKRQKAKPWLFTPQGCSAVSDLLAQQLQSLNLNPNSAERWIQERVELPEGVKVSGAAIAAIVNKRYATFRPETLEILCASGIFEPKTREQIWAIACEMSPKDEGGSENDPLPPIELIEKAIAQVGQALQTLRGASTIVSPMHLPTTRTEAIATLQAILAHNYPGWTAQEIADHLRYDGFAYVTPAEVDLWIQGQSLLSNDGRSALALKKHRPQLPWGGPVTDRWLTHLSEAFWDRRPSAGSNAGTSININGSLV